MPEPIVFYDIPGNVKGTAWSPNTWRIRYTLNYKRLPYKTVWVEYPDIESTCAAIGAKPTSARPDGTPYRTLPAIYDPNTGTGIADSLPIARYLDATYPDAPRAMPPGTDALHEAFQVAMDAVLFPQMRLLVMPLGLERLHEASRGFYRAAREWQLGGRMEEWAPVGSELRKQRWREVEEGFGKVKGWIEADGRTKVFVMCDEPSLADFMVAARLQWMKKVFGEDDAEWKAVEAWDGGHWARLLEALVPY